MANGTIHKLGTLYVGGTKIPRPTKPWYGTNGGASSSGNLYDYDNSGKTVEIKDTDAAEANQLQWVEVNDGDDKLLICDRNLMCFISWERLNVLGFCGAKGSGKTITIDGQEYELFMLTGGKNASVQSETTPSNEWEKYIGNLGKFDGLPTPQAQDLSNSSSSANFNTAHNKVWNWAGCYSWCQNTTNDGSSYRAARGYAGARYWNYSYSGSINSYWGWRPALRVLNAAPQITPGSKSIGEINKPQDISYSISDEDGEQFNVIVKVDGVQKESYADQTDKSYTFQMSKYWDALNLGAHTVEISATDINHATTTATYTFTRINTAPTITPASASLGDLKRPQDIEYTIQDADGDSLTVVVQIDNVEKERYENQKDGKKTFEMEQYWAEMGLGSHTVKVIVTDIWDKSTTATYTLAKRNGPAEAPRITTPGNNMRREADFYVEFDVGEDTEGDTQTVKIQAADDASFQTGVREFAVMEKLSGSTWTEVATASNADVGSKFRIRVTGLSGDKYLRAVALDSGSGMPAYSAVIHVRIGTVLEVMTHPSDTDGRAQKAIVLLDLVADAKTTKDIWVCNNANDAAPTWEAYNPDSAGNHTFSNTEKTAEKWAVAAKLKVTANDSTGEIALRAIGMGVL